MSDKKCNFGVAKIYYFDILQFEIKIKNKENLERLKWLKKDIEKQNKGVKNINVY